MSIQNFEKKVQSLFEQYRPEMDHEQIWENIEPHLKKKKNAGHLSCFSGLWGWGYWLFCGIQKMPGNNFQAGNDRFLGDKKHAVVESNAAAQFPDSRLTEKSGTANIPAVPSDEGQKQQAGSSSKSRAYRADNQPIETRNTRNNLEGNTSETRADEIRLTAGIEVQSTSDQVFQKPAHEPAVSIHPSPEMPLADESSPLLETAETPEPKYTSADSTAARSKAKKASVLPKKKPSKAKKMNRIKPHKRKRIKQTLSLHTGLILPLKVLRENNGVTENAALLASRKSSEKMLEAFSSSIHYTYATRKGLLFRGGIEYKRLNEQFSVGYTKKEEEIVTGVLTQTINSSGDVIAQTTGPKKVTTTRTFSNVAYNNYQFWNIPVGMGFQKFNRKSQWEIAGGLDLNISFHFEGTLFNASGTASKLFRSQYAAVYKKTVGTGMWASYGYSRNLSRNIRWQVLAKASLPFQAITSDRYRLVQKYYTLGLQGGLIFNLTKEPPNKHKKRR